jgi:hypothetical protein
MRRIGMRRTLLGILAMLLLVSMRDGEEGAALRRRAMPLPKFPEPPPAISPKDEPIILFNGKDLSGFYTWLLDTKKEDPRKVFSVQDKMIHISGDGFGYLATEKRYANYELIAEFKWGEKNFRGRENKARDSGIFLHAYGPDGNSVDGQGAYKGAIECQIMEGAVGDLLKIRSKEWVIPFGDGLRAAFVIQPRWTANVSEEQDAEGYRWWRKNGKAVRDEGRAGRLNWKSKDANWRDVLGFRGKHDAESPLGEWTRIECTCWDNTITIAVNDQVVNQIKDCLVFKIRESDVSAGQILLQCEGSEIYFRRLELWPLPKIEEVK